MTKALGNNSSCHKNMMVMKMITGITLTYGPGTTLHTCINLYNEMKDIKRSRTNWQVKWLYLKALESLKKNHKAGVKISFVIPPSIR